MHGTRIGSWALMILLSLSLAGCALVGTTRKDRLARFEVGLNEDREHLFMDFYAPATSDYTTLETTAVGETWDAWFPTDYPDLGTYTVTFVDRLPAPNPGVEATVTGPSAFHGPKTLRAYMVRVGLDWYLEKLVLDGATIVD